MTPGATVVDAAFSRGLQPDPNMPVDQWSDQYMIIPKDSGANEYGKYRTSRTPHARQVMRALSDDHPCKRVALMGASQMLKTQVGLNWFAASVHQSPGNFLWILPTGKLAKRTSTRIAKTIAAVPELTERVASPRSRDSVNTLDTKEYIGGALFIVTAGAAANLSEVPARRVLFDEVDRAEANVNGEGDPVALAEARQTTFERNRKAYYPSSPTITGESIIEKLYLRGTQHIALADCVHCGHAQPLEFERLILSDDGQNALYPCMECGACMTETDKNRMFGRGAWSEGVPGDGETVSFTINALFLPYGWLPWIALVREYGKAKAKLEEGSEESMIAFYNTRLARCWERSKEQTKYDALMLRAEDYRLGRVPAGGLRLTAAIDTQNERLEFKVVAWGRGMECWVVDYQIIHGSPAEDATWASADALLKGKYRHAHGQLLGIDAAFIDSGGAHTQDVYNFTYSRKRSNIFSIKGASRPDKPIICAKPTIVDITWRGKTEKRGAQLWFVGTDTAKDYLASRWKYGAGPGAVHFSNDLKEDYYKQLTAEYRVSGYKRGRRVSWWEKKQSDPNEALDLMVYNLSAAYFLGLHKKTEHYWQTVSDKLNPLNLDMFAMPEAAPTDANELKVKSTAGAILPDPDIYKNNSEIDIEHPVGATSSTTFTPVSPNRIMGKRITLNGLRRGAN
jgi:phage terminase large subunit GpA-like protein